MSGTKKILLAMLFGSITASGCTKYIAVTPSVAGRTFVVAQQGGRFGKSALWNCDATTGTPSCYRVRNVPSGPVTVPTGDTAPSPSPAVTAPAGEATND